MAGVITAKTLLRIRRDSGSWETLQGSIDSWQLSDQQRTRTVPRLSTVSITQPLPHSDTSITFTADDTPDLAQEFWFRSGETREVELTIDGTIRYQFSGPQRCQLTSEPGGPRRWQVQIVASGEVTRTRTA